MPKHNYGGKNRMSNVIIVEVEGGYFRAEPSLDPDYPGIDVEFISHDEPEDILSHPRVLFERPAETKELRALIWSDPKKEDYVSKLTFDKP